MDHPHEQTILEEIFNSITCGIGFCLSVAALAVLVVSASLGGDVRRIVSVSIYGTSLALLFLFSTLYHCIPSKKAKRVFEILDHCAIYVLIAGTYTPFVLVTLKGPWGWVLFGVVWSAALLGILFKTFFIVKFRLLSAVIYLLMGWLIVVALQPLVRNLAPEGIGWLLVGGVIYSAGLLFYSWRKLPFHHTLWHFFVLAGCVCHFFAVLFYVVPVL
jgi:hemolysin III